MFGPRPIFAAVLVATLVAACSGADKSLNSNKMFNSDVKGSIAGSFILSGLSPSAAVAGAEVTLAGDGLTDDIQVTMDGAPVMALTSDHKTSVKFNVPDGPPGLRMVRVQKGSETASLNFLRLGSHGEAVVAGALSEVCSGDSFYDVDGKRLQGTKDCVAELRHGSVHADSIAGGAVTAGALADASVTTPKLANSAVTADKLAPGAVGLASLADMQCHAGQLLKWHGAAWACDDDHGVASGVAVGTTDLSDGAVTAAKLAAGSVSDAMVAANAAIDPAKLGAGGATAAGQVLRWDGTKWTGSSLTNADLPANFDAGRLTTGALPPAAIAAGSLDGTKLAAGSMGVDRLAGAGCAAGQVVAWNGTAFACAPQSVNGKTGAVTLTSADVPEGASLYYSDTRVRSALSATAPLTFNPVTGVLSQPAAGPGVSGYLSAADWVTFNAREPAITAGSAAAYWRGDKTWQTLTSAAVPETSNLYYTDVRARAALSGAAPVAFDPVTGVISQARASAGADGYLAATDWVAFNAKEPGATGGTTLQYWRGDKTWQTLSTVAVTENPASGLYYTDTRARASLSASGPLDYDPVGGGLTLAPAGAVQAGYLTASDWTAFNGKEGGIALGTTAQFWRGDKTWQGLNTGAVPENGNLYFTSSRAYAIFSATAPLQYDGAGTYSMAQATATANGFIGTADWVQFNAKQAALGYTPVNRAGDTMAGPLNMGGLALTNVAAPSASTDAANKGYVDGKVAKAGDTMAGNLDLGGNKITGLGTPTSGTDAATKTYVDTTNTGLLAAALRKDGSTPLTAPWNVGAQDLTNAGNLGLAPGKTLMLGNLTNAQETALIATLTVFDAGKSWYNTGGSLRYWDGSAVQTLATGTVINSLDGLTATAQLFSIGGAGTAPAWTTSGVDTHVLNLPLAATAGTTAGLLSNADWTTFNAKQNAINGATVLSVGTVKTGQQDGVELQPWGAGAGQSGELRFDALSGGNYVGFKAPDTVLSNKIWTLPAGDGSASQTLRTDGAGHLTWANPVGVNAPLTYVSASATVGLPLSTTSADGYLASGDWALFNAKEPPIAAAGGGTYWRGDKSFQTLNTAAVAESAGSLYFTTARARTALSTTSPIFAGETITGVASAILKTDAAGVVGAAVAADLTGLIGSGKYVATTGDAMTGQLDLGSNRITNVTDPSGPATSDVATANWVTTQAGAFLKKDGTVPLTGTWNTGAQDITNIGNVGIAGGKLLQLGSFAGSPGLSQPADAGKVWYDNSGVVKYYDGAATQTMALATNTVALGGQAGALSFGTNNNTPVTLLQNNTPALVVNGGGYVSIGTSVPGVVFSVGGAARVQGNLTVDSTLIFGDSTSQSTAGVQSVTAPLSGHGTSASPLTIPVASSTANGYLSSTDWSAFSGMVKKDGSVPLTAAWNEGGQDITNVGNVAMALSKSLLLGNFTSDPGGLSAADKGRIWYNTTSGQMKYWDGLTAQVLATTAVGIQSLDGLFGSAQTFAYGTAGTAPAWAAGSNTHTLNIPMASAASVTGGLLSNSDWTTFNAKQPAITGATNLSVATLTTNNQNGITLNSSGGLAGELHLVDPTSANYVGFKATPGMIGSKIWALPIADGTGGQVLKTDGAGNLSWTGHVTSVAGRSGAVTLTTPDVAESGGINYFSLARARGAFSTTAPLAYDGTGGYSLAKASAGVDGYLASADWALFNSKQPAITGATTLTTGTLKTDQQDGLELKPYGTVAGSTGEIRFDELTANGNQYVGFKAADSLAASLVWTLPTTLGSAGDTLINNGSGVLSWGAANLPLTGDVTGTSNASVVSAISGRPLLFGSVSNGDILTWNGTNWINSSTVGFPGSPMTNVETKQINLANNGSAMTCTATDGKVQLENNSKTIYACLGGLKTKIASAGHIMFVTSSTTVNGSFGASGANTICATRASGGTAIPAGFATTWLAVLDGSGFVVTDDVYNTKGELISTAEGFWSGTHQNPVYYDENGATPTGTMVWTGLNPDGTASGTNCSSWTAPGGAVNGTVGLFKSSSGSWINSGVQPCNSTMHFMCISQ